ncbi:hypothetical protein [Fluviicola taffensis]|uniref:hypothetical protein n=1 Tax=Fluviicola taffensis TaxID=191579 RepID=UPI003137ADD0
MIENVCDWDPNIKLSITSSVHDGVYTYTLVTEVINKCLNTGMEFVSTEPRELELFNLCDEINSNELNVLVQLEAAPCENNGSVRTKTTILTNNPTGEEGFVIVFVSFPASWGRGPEASGKAIIRFDKRQ